MFIIAPDLSKSKEVPSCLTSQVQPPGLSKTSCLENFKSLPEQRAMISASSTRYSLTCNPAWVFPQKIQIKIPVGFVTRSWIPDLSPLTAFSALKVSTKLIASTSQVYQTHYQYCPFLTDSSVPNTCSVSTSTTTVTVAPVTQPPGTYRTTLTSSLHPRLPAITTAVSLSCASPCPASSAITAPNPSCASNTEIARIITEVGQNHELSGMLSSLDPTTSSFLPRSLNNQHQPSSTKATKQKSKNQDFGPENAKIEALKIELSYARTKIVDLENKVKNGQESLKIYAHKVKILEETRTAFLTEKYSTHASQPGNISTPATFSSNTSVPSSDCPCQIRAKLTENCTKMKELELRFSELCHVVDRLARLGQDSDESGGVSQAPLAELQKDFFRPLSGFSTRKCPN